jgi:hypothetical protein
MRISRLGYATGLLLATGLSAGAADRPLVVELFTSQGCSSCPPAEAFLSELGQGRPDLLPLALHVTYWDNGSWRDPFSLAAATERQRSYARRLGRGTVYTPQMVIEGGVDVVGGDRGAAARVLESMAERAVTAAPMRLTRRGIDLALDIGAGEGSGTVWLIGFDHAHRTSVRGGENAGHSLDETNVVRELAPLGAWGGKALALHHPAPAGEDFAALLQADDGRIIGAARLAAPPRGAPQPR